jgi:hypothetical protein
MLFTCKMHITAGLKQMDVPHVNRIRHCKDVSCYFCNKEADFTLFHSLSVYRLIRQKTEYQLD